MCVSEKRHPGRGSGRHKSVKAGTCLGHLRNWQGVTEAGMEPARGVAVRNEVTGTIGPGYIRPWRPSLGIRI